MLNSIDFCDNLSEYFDVILFFYFIPGIILLWVMGCLAERNPIQNKQDEDAKIGFLPQCLWVFITMFGGIFLVDKETYEKFKKHRILQKAIFIWSIIVFILIVVSREKFPGIFVNNYEVSIKGKMSLIYFGDIQIRDLPSFEIYYVTKTITSFFLCLSIGIYALSYRPSPTKIWLKTGDALGIVLLYSSYYILTNAYTLVAIIFVGILIVSGTLFLIDYKKPKKHNELIEDIDVRNEQSNSRDKENEITKTFDVEL